MSSAPDNKKRIDKKAKHCGYEYKSFMLSAHMPSNRKSAVYDSRDVDFALNKLAKDGWEYAGQLVKEWKGFEPFNQHFEIFRRKIS